MCEESLTPWVQQDLLRIAQEAISNAIRHARPTVISVSLRRNPPNLVLKIRDKGSGIANDRSSSEGFGFVNMRARAKNIGAELDIRSRAGSGTSGKQLSDMRRSNLAIIARRSRPRPFHHNDWVGC
jgi:signal transduction histidine kinase